MSEQSEKNGWDRVAYMAVWLALRLKGVSEEHIDRLAMPEPLWTVAEVAKYLSVNPQTVRRYAYRGVLPAYYTEGEYRFRREEIDARMKQWSEHRQAHVAVRRAKRRQFLEAQEKYEAAEDED